MLECRPHDDRREVNPPHSLRSEFDPSHSSKSEVVTCRDPSHAPRSEVRSRDPRLRLVSLPGRCGLRRVVVGKVEMTGCEIRDRNNAVQFFAILYVVQNYKRFLGSVLI